MGGALLGDSVTIEDSVLSGNQADAISTGGGAAVGDPIIVRRSVITDNASIGTTSTTSGGAFWTLSGTVEIVDSTLAGNRVTSDSGLVRGAAVYAAGITLRNTTVTQSRTETSSGQVAAPVRSTGNITVEHATIASNDGGGSTAALEADGDLISTASVLAYPPDGESMCDIGGSTTSTYSYDISGSCGFGSGAGDVASGDDPLLGQVRNNGDVVAAAEAGGNGTVRPTMFPLNGSPLVDAVPAGECSAAPELAEDQRGVDRPFATGCDIGAIEAVFPAHAQNGVTPFYEATVRWVTSEENTPQILSGYPDGSFGESLNITRGQAARLYYRGAGAPDVSGAPAHGFTDVSAFYEDAVKWAKSVGLFDGFTDNTFRPNNPISRGNYIRSLYNFAGAQNVSGLPAHGFGDVTAFYEDAVKWAKAYGLADGFTDNTFRQGDNINRGNAGRTFYNTAQTKPAWADTMSAPPNMLFKDNLTV